MLKQADIHLARLIALREEAFPLAFEAEKRGHLDLDHYVSECGTYRCLLGWWIATPTAKEDGWHFHNGYHPTWRGKTFGSAKAYFGISEGDWGRLFGTSDKGTLTDRLAHLDRLIAERMQVAA